MKYIKITHNREVAIFNWDNIICIDELDGVIDIITRDGKRYRFNGNFKDIEKQLKEKV